MSETRIRNESLVTIRDAMVRNEEIARWASRESSRFEGTLALGALRSMSMSAVEASYCDGESAVGLQCAAQMSHSSLQPVLPISINDRDRDRDRDRALVYFTEVALLHHFTDPPEDSAGCHPRSSPRPRP
jgi:hypothetical protein